MLPFCDIRGIELPLVINIHNNTGLKYNCSRLSHVNFCDLDMFFLVEQT